MEDEPAARVVRMGRGDDARPAVLGQSSDPVELELDPIIGGAYLAPLDAVMELPLSQLSKAFRVGDAGWGLILSTLASGYWEPDYADRWVHLRADTRGRVLARYIVMLDHDEDPFSEQEEARVHALLESLLRPFGAVVRTVEFDPSEAGLMAPWPYGVTISVPTRGRLINDIAGLVVASEALVSAVGSGALQRTDVLALLRAGFAVSLVGQPESVFLDVKRQHYDLASTADKIELAQDVARFANAEAGGIVVVGMRGKKVPGGEVIAAVTPIQATAADALRYRQVIESRVYPLIDGLEVFSTDAADGQVLVVHVPPQQDELKPFLVHGAIVDGKVEGAFISIVRRRDEHSVPITAPTIHAMLAAGRALLRRGELPRRDPKPEE